MKRGYIRGANLTTATLNASFCATVLRIAQKPEVTLTTARPLLNKVKIITTSKLLSPLVYCNLVS